MGQRFGIIVAAVLALVALVAINSLSYVSPEDRPDSEISPNRSTYNARATGTRALYDFLSESSYKVMRWRSASDQLVGTSGKNVRTFVIIGTPRQEVSEEEAKSLLLWVERGGRLVIIDRRPPDYLLPRSGDWNVTTELLEYPEFGVDASDPEQMTKDVKPLSPAQTTSLTRNVDVVMPSRYFSAIRFFAAANDPKARIQADDSFEDDEDSDSTTPITNEANASAGSPAPVVHLKHGNTTLLADYVHGRGRIVLLSDPYIFANGGIGQRDNLQLALNILNSEGGLIAFDEFHQGRGETHNAFASYFSGTPVLAIFGQLVLLILLVVWSRGRRFARPLPLPGVDRRSSLEFVASMAELQQRAKAFDLAIENIYARTRRVLARYAGVDYNSSRTVIAERVAARSTMDAHQLSTLMRQAEEAINGGAINERQSIYLVKRLREVEGALGLRMRSRQVKQAAENI